MKINVFVKEGEPIPTGYALRRICLNRLGYEVSLMPFNFVFRLWDWLYRRMNTITGYDKELLSEFSKARDTGFKEGIESGERLVEMKFNKNMEDITKELKELGILIRLEEFKKEQTK